jgi:hypothetical protein
MAGTSHSRSQEPGAQVSQVPNNKRTLAILASVALMFFVGVIVKRWLFG